MSTPSLKVAEQAKGIDKRELRRCLSSYATGVAVATARVNGIRVGVTMNSFASVSLDPPLVLWSISRTSRSFSVFIEAEHFAVNILSAQQIDLSRRFSGPDDDKFVGLETAHSLTGAPVLKDVVAALECRCVAQYEGGDHVIMLGRVENFHTVPGRGLVFSRGNYAVVQEAPDEATHPPTRDEARTESKQDFFSSLYWAFNSMSKRFGRYREGLGVTLAESRVLIQLFENPDIAMDRLIELTYSSDRVIDEAVQSLVARKDVVRQGDGSLRLTSKGRQRRRLIGEKALEFERQQTSRIPAEDIAQAQLVLDCITSQVSHPRYKGS